MRRAEIPVPMTGDDSVALAASLALVPALVREGVAAKRLQQPIEISEIRAGLPRDPIVHTALDTRSSGTQSAVRGPLLDGAPRLPERRVLRKFVDAADLWALPLWNVAAIRVSPEGHQLQDSVHGGAKYHPVFTFGRRRGVARDVAVDTAPEAFSYAAGIGPGQRQRLGLPQRWTRWACAASAPVARWRNGHRTLLDDATHPIRCGRALDGGWAMPTVATAAPQPPSGVATQRCRMTYGMVSFAIDEMGPNELDGQHFETAPHDIVAAPRWCPTALYAAGDWILFPHADRLTPAKLGLFRKERLSP